MHLVTSRRQTKSLEILAQPGVHQEPLCRMWHNTAGQSLVAQQKETFSLTLGVVRNAGSHHTSPIDSVAKILSCVMEASGYASRASSKRSECEDYDVQVMRT